MAETNEFEDFVGQIFDYTDEFKNWPLEKQQTFKLAHGINENESIEKIWMSLGEDGKVRFKIEKATRH